MTTNDDLLKATRLLDYSTPRITALIEQRRWHHLPNWRDDADFSDMIQTLIAAMPLEKESNLKVKSLKQILALTGGVTSRIFALVKDLSTDAILNGEKCITDEAIANWKPVWSRHATVQRRLERSGA